MCVLTSKCIQDILLLLFSLLLFKLGLVKSIIDIQNINKKLLRCIDTSITFFQFSIIMATTVNQLSTQIWGYAGGFFLTIVLVPQVYRTYSQKNINGLSSLFLLFELLASVCFCIYGFLLPNHSGIPVVISNSSALLCTCALVAAKIIFKKKALVDTSEGSNYNSIV